MQLKRFVIVGLGPGIVSARVLSRRSVDCGLIMTADSGDTCQSFAATWALSVDDFMRLNPGITCPTLDAGKPYCVMGTATDDLPVSTTTTIPLPASTTSTGLTSTLSTSTVSTPVGSTITQSSTKPSLTTTSMSSTTARSSTTTKSSTSTSAMPTNTPRPIQDGMVGNCNRFHFVQQDQTCATIAALYSISVAQFIQWNPAAKADCSGLWASTYACVGIIGGNPTPTTTTKPGNGIPTPTPSHPGMVSNCNKFVYVNPGDTCDGIAFFNGVEGGGKWVKLWNGIEEECRSIQAYTYVCIGVIGGTPTTPTTTTKPGNGIATPTPTQPGMVGNCNKFVYVKPGDTCDGIAFWNGVEGGGKWVKLWNGIEEECRSLQAYTYVCIGVF